MSNSVREPDFGDAIAEVDEEVLSMVEWVRKRVRLKGWSADKWDEDHTTATIDWLTHPDLRKLVAYLSDDGDLALLTPHSMVPVAPTHFLYFIKDGKALTPATMNSVKWGYVNGGGLDSLQRLMSGVYVPHLVNNTAWPDSVKKDFRAQVHRFMASVIEAVSVGAASAPEHAATATLT